jgi:hypothetical protein
MYVTVLAASVAVGVIALSAMLSLRISRRSMEQGGDFSMARYHAQTAVELGLWTIRNQADWRSTQPNGYWRSNQPIGDGLLSLTGVDPNDGNLANSKTDPVVLTGIGVQGDARYQLQVRLAAELKPLAALKTCLHTGGNATVNLGNRITVSGAPLSSNATVTNLGTISGSVEAAAVVNSGTITGSTTVPAPSKRLPDTTVFDYYKNLATPVAAGSFDKQVLGPGFNSRGGGTNPDGVYYIDTGGADLTIQNSRIYGTLVVKTGAGKLILNSAARLKNYRADYPVLIVSGNLEIRLDSATLGLLESTNNTNFNPPGAPSKEGTSDTDTADTYPNEIEGLVHVTGTLVMGQTSRVRGAVIGESTVTIGGTNEIVHNPTLYSSPPVGYTEPPAMKVVSGSWAQEVD